ncbi:hypothetical protein [Aeromonas caviae]|uniref:hypothetical protein n=1 Tax=Aeromonas caviae TaxID=648 RepID=UPI002B471E5F|nr:hypothetical protein [Aeromonas caviae]
MGVINVHGLHLCLDAGREIHEAEPVVGAVTVVVITERTGAILDHEFGRAFANEGFEGCVIPGSDLLLGDGHINDLTGVSTEQLDLANGDFAAIAVFGGGGDVGGRQNLGDDLSCSYLDSLRCVVGG